MRTAVTIAEVRAFTASLRREGKRIGFVPTMGYLHEGHLSLMRCARAENDAVVASIFVNPTQFGPAEDLERYPRDSQGDSTKCAGIGVDLLFMPAVQEMYSEGPTVFVDVDGVSEVLEGSVRPGHFRGVATVVAKLFHIVTPDRAYFGQKDYQQYVVIKRMVQGLDLNVQVAVLPTVREPDGLAMSSRNIYLDREQRQKATSIYRALRAGEDLVRAGVRDSEQVRQKMRAVLLQEKNLVIDYAEVAHPDTLDPVETVAGRVVLLIAARLGATRLIDNVLLL